MLCNVSVNNNGRYKKENVMRGCSTKKLGLKQLKENNILGGGNS